MYRDCWEAAWEKPLLHMAVERVPENKAAHGHLGESSGIHILVLSLPASSHLVFTCLECLAS